MSLSGYLPPLCDPVDGHLLLDGGYVSVLPGKCIQSYRIKILYLINYTVYMRLKLPDNNQPKLLSNIT